MVVSDILRRNASLYPTATVIIRQGRHYSWGEVGVVARRLAYHLYDLGIRKGDHVAILSQNSPEFVFLTFALARMGAVLVPLNFRLTPPEIIHLLRDSQAKILFFSQDFAATVEAIRPSLPDIQHCLSLDHAEDLSLHDSTSSCLPEGSAGPEDLFVLLYSSGTTGLPKGVMLTHRNVLATANTFALEMRMWTNDISLLAVPLFHSGGIALMLGTLYVGGKLVITGHFDPQQALQLMEEEEITVLAAVPTMIRSILEEQKRRAYRTASLAKVVYGAAPMPPEQIAEAMTVFPHCGFHQIYGLTETGGIATFLPPADHSLQGPLHRRLASCGREALGLHVKVVDDEGREVGPGEMGEIIIQGDAVTKGYWRMPEETARCLRNGWFFSGDLATADHEGYLYIRDRRKDIIVSGGENISSKEIEDIIGALPNVREVAVIGVPDPVWGEAVKAIAVRAPGAVLSEEDILRHCQGTLAGYKRPKSVAFVDVLPRNASGKVLKHELRQRFRRETEGGA